MNLRINKNNKNISIIRLICVIISAFFIVACEKPNELGVELQDQDDLINLSLTDTISIESKSVLLNNIESYGLSILLAGSYDDTEIGHEVVTSSYFQYRTSEDNPDFGSNPVCDSIKLILDYTGYYYGDTTVSQTYHVYQLTEEMSEDSSYKTTSNVTFDASEIGSVSSPVYPQSVDTFTIELDNTFGQELLDNAGNYTPSDFATVYKGLKIEAGNGSTGAVVGFDLSSSNTRVELYYHNDDDTTSYDFDMSNSYPCFNKVSATYTTALSGLTNTGDSVVTANTNNVGFIQAGTGLVTKLTFPHLDKFSEIANEITINRAEIILSGVDGTFNGDHDEPPLFIQAYKTDKSNEILLDEDDNGELIENFSFLVGESSTSQFTLDEDNHQYKLNITSYFQDLVNGNETNSGMIIIPAFVNATRVSRFLYYDQENVSKPEEALKIRVYFTSNK